MSKLILETLDIKTQKYFSSLGFIKKFVNSKRPKWRDYVDLYFILKDKYLTLEEIINLAIKKFKNDFSQKLFLEQLVYWDDVYNYEIDFVKDELPSETIKAFLENEVREYNNTKLI